MELNENNRNDGSLKSILGKFFGQTIIKGVAEEKPEQVEDDNEESEEEDYEQENYNHFVGENEEEEFEEDSEELSENEQAFEKFEQEELEQKKAKKKEREDKNQKDMKEMKKKEKQKEQLKQKEQTKQRKDNTNSKARSNTEVFIENISTNKTEKQINKFLNSLGQNFTKVKILKGPDGSIRGKAFIKFATLEEAQTFFDDHTDKTEYDGKKLALKIIDNTNAGKSEKTKVKDFKVDHNKSHTAYIGNLSVATDDKTLKKHFKNTSNIRLMRSNDGKSKGFGYIDFVSEDALNKALEKGGFTIDAKEIKIERAKSSFSDQVYEDSKSRLGKKKQRIAERQNY